MHPPRKFPRRRIRRYITKSRGYGITGAASPSPNLQSKKQQSKKWPLCRLRKKKCKNPNRKCVHMRLWTHVRTRTDAFWTIFGRTELIISVSGAKNCEESDFEVRFYVAPQKPRKNAEKRAFSTNFVFETFFFGVEKWKLGNCLKHVLAKFQAERSQVWGVNGRSKFRKNVRIR